MGKGRAGKKRQTAIGVGKYCLIKAAWMKTFNKDLDIDTLVGPANHGREVWARVVASTGKRMYNLQVVSVPGATGFLTGVPRKKCGEKIVSELPEMAAEATAHATLMLMAHTGASALQLPCSCHRLAIASMLGVRGCKPRNKPSGMATQARRRPACQCT